MGFLSRLAWVLIPLATAILNGCSGSDLLNATVPSSGYTRKKDIAYGPEARHKLDIYAPDKPDITGAVVVFFYGGSWKSGSKDIYPFVGQALAARGYTVVIPDYRVYPEVKYPVFLQDAAKAVSWVHAHIAEHGANPENIFLAGHSAGGYNAVMLGLNESFLKAEGYNAKKLRGIIGLAGPYDFLPLTDPDLVEVFQGDNNAESQPITYAGPNKPPLLLLHGDADEDVGQKNAVNLKAKQDSFHSPVLHHEYAGVGHYGIILAVSGLFRSKAPTVDDMAAFIALHAQ
ncbi:MAG: alpha/beta hydrolase [Rickettsiales bacterium]|nr:alpha/beta hydrolase [Rickettsiales bacterium]